jgi:hypothetical protein
MQTREMQRGDGQDTVEKVGVAECEGKGRGVFVVGDESAK